MRQDPECREGFIAECSGVLTGVTVVSAKGTGHITGPWGWGCLTSVESAELASKGRAGRGRVGLGDEDGGVVMGSFLRGGTREFCCHLGTAECPEGRNLQEVGTSTQEIIPANLGAQ